MFQRNLVFANSWFFFLLLWFAVNSFALADEDQAANKVAELIQHAETYYWIGLSEQGNVKAFEKGQLINFLLLGACMFEVGKRLSGLTKTDWVVVLLGKYS